MVGDAKCPYCGAITHNGNDKNTFGRCYKCYRYFDIEKAIIEGAKNTEQLIQLDKDQS